MCSIIQSSEIATFKSKNDVLLLPMELLSQIMHHMNIQDRINFARTHSSLYQNLCIENDAQTIFTMHDQHVYLQSLVFCGKRSAAKPLDLLIKHETKENSIVREKIIKLYFQEANSISHNKHNIQAIINNPSMSIGLEPYETALYVAAIRTKNYEEIQLLLKYFDINKQDLSSTLFMTWELNKLKSLEVLLQHPLVNPNEILHIIIHYPKKISFLLKHAHQKVNFNTLNKEGKSAMDIINEYMKNPYKYPYYWSHLSVEERHYLLLEIKDYEKSKSYNGSLYISFLYYYLSYIFTITKKMINIVFTKFNRT